MIVAPCPLLDERCSVSACGAVFGVTGTTLRPVECRGYLRVATHDVGGSRRHFSVHRLVAWTFHGPPPSAEHEVAHLDGNRTNNCAANLAWATKVENASHRLDHGTQTSALGSAHPFARLSEDVVRFARELSGEVPMSTLARAAGVHKETMRRAVLGSTWRAA